MKRFTFLLILLSTALDGHAQRPPLGAEGPDRTSKAPAGGPIVETAAPADQVPDSPERMIERFFSYLQRREVEQAYDQLTRGTKIAERAEDVKTLKSKTKEAITVFGPILGYDFVVKKNVGTRLVSYTAVSLGKEFPLRWRFYFYKPQDAWKLIDLRVDDRLATMFDEREETRSHELRP